MHRRPIALLVTGLSVIALAVGCGQSDKSGRSSDGGYSAPGGSSPSVADTGPALHLLESKYGKIVVDAQGYVLYLFDKDTASPPKSNCSGQCAAKWPPEPYTRELEVNGIDKSLIGSLKRDDGSQQLTVAGWPMYRYAPDTSAGDVKGQAVGGVWWVVDAGGKKVTTSPAP